MSTKGRTIFAVALFASLVANGVLVFLLLSKEKGEEIKQTTRSNCPESAVRSDPNSSKEGSEERADKLSALPMSIFLRKMGDFPSKANDGEGETEEEAEQRILCDISRRIVADDWTINKERNLKSAARSLTDPQERERNIKERIDKFNSALDLCESDLEAFDSEYRLLREKTDPALAEELSKKDPDFKLAFELAEDFFAEEQNLVNKLFGEEAQTKTTDHLREDRFVVLSVLATWAKMDWNKAIEY